MANQNMQATQPPQAPQNLDGLREQIEAFGAEAKDLSASYARRWKVTAAAFLILCIVIFGYLYLFVYSPVKELGFLDPEEVVHIAVSNVVGKAREQKQNIFRTLEDDAPRIVDEYIGPEIDQLKAKLPELRAEAAKQLTANVEQVLDTAKSQIGEVKTWLPQRREQFTTWVKENAPKHADKLDPHIEKLKGTIRQTVAEKTEELKKDAPEIVAKHVAPGIKKMKEELPEHRKEIIADLRKKAPELVTTVKEQIINKLLPLGRQGLAIMVAEQAKLFTEQAQMLINAAVKEVVRDQKAVLKQKVRKKELTEAIQAAFEKKLGPALDEYLKMVEATLMDANRGFASLVKKKKEGTLSYAEKLEYRYVQLWRTLFVVKLKEAPAKAK